MASNEFHTCKKAINRATTKLEIYNAVEILDEIWQQSGKSQKIMKDGDWWRLVILVHKAIKKI
jgi:hypothetical protein